MEPEQIEGRQFGTTLRGYDRQEVEDFAREVAEQVRQLRSDLAAMEAALQEAKSTPQPDSPPAARSVVPSTKVDVYKQLGEETARILISAEQAANEIKELAKREAAEVLADARREAGRIARQTREGKQQAEADLRHFLQTRGLLADQLEEVRRRLAEAVARLQAPLEQGQVSPVKQGPPPDVLPLLDEARHISLSATSGASAGHSGQMESKASQPEDSSGRQMPPLPVMQPKPSSADQNTGQGPALAAVAKAGAGPGGQKSEFRTELPSGARPPASQAPEPASTQKAVPPPAGPGDGSAPAAVGSPPGRTGQPEAHQPASTQPDQKIQPPPAPQGAGPTLGSPPPPERPMEAGPQPAGGGPEKSASAGSSGQSSGSSAGSSRRQLSAPSAGSSGQSSGPSAGSSRQSSAPSAASSGPQPAPATPGISGPRASAPSIGAPSSQRKPDRSRTGAPPGFIEHGSTSLGTNRERRTGVPAPANGKGQAKGRSGDIIERLLEEIREDALETPEASGPVRVSRSEDTQRPVTAPIREKGQPEGPGGSQGAIFQVRAEALGESSYEAARKLKRLLQEDHNELLHRLRSQRGRGALEDNVIPEDQQLERFNKALQLVLQKAFSEGRRVAGARDEGDPSSCISTLVAKQVVLPLRGELSRVVENGLAAKDTPSAISERASDVFRIWKGVRTELLGEGLVLAAFHQGLLDAWSGKPKVAKRWVLSPDEEECPKGVCRANASEGAVPVGETFSSGHISPPAHGGCSCGLEPS